MSNHTPGPWAEKECVGEVIEIRAGCPSYPIATMNRDKAPFKTKGSEEREKANARLIAAAPELLDACETALNALCGPHGIKGPGTPEHHAREELRAAIRKARGE